MHRQVMPSRWHLSCGEDMQASGGIYPLHFAQYDPGEDSQSSLNLAEAVLSLPPSPEASPQVPP